MISERNSFDRTGTFFLELNALQPLLIRSKDIDEIAMYAWQFIVPFMHLSGFALARLNNEIEFTKYLAVCGLSDEATNASLAYLNDQSPAMIESLKNAQEIDVCIPAPHPDLLDEGDDTLRIYALPAVYEKKMLGIAIFARSGNKPFLEIEKRQMQMLISIVAISFANKDLIEDAALQSYIYNEYMESMQANLFVSDLKTDKILFMSSNMQAAYGITDPIGKRCYEVLQREKTSRCDFCPIDKLLLDEDEHPLCMWEEEVAINGRTYEHYDSLMRWTDGSIVHFQHSVDVTDTRLQSRDAEMDELTEMLNRRHGKLALEKTLRKMREEKSTFTVAMYDVNNLKRVNDSFGHSEGDFLISTIASTLKHHLKGDSYPFRLSGDEFIVVFPRIGQSEAMRIMERALESLKEKQAVLYKPYDMGFCYGLVECPPDASMSQSDILRQTDARMYEAKRKFHIAEAVRNMTDNSLMSASLGAEFTYDRERLYDALVKSTDDYIFVCNMKSGIFHFPPSFLEEFDFPGEFIENAAAVWEKIIHPYDRSAFLQSFQEILDGRANSQTVEYRALNKKNEWVWLRCRGYLVREDDGESSLFAGIITNLGKKNKVDHITGLLNKHEFESAVNNLLTTRPKSPIGIMLLNLDEFRRVNDMYNREFGDEVLRITAHKLLSLLPANATLYRMDGDEFAALFHHGMGDELEEFFLHVRQMFEKQQEYAGKKYFCTLSAGAALYPMDAINFLDLSKAAGYALEYAKSRGKGTFFFFSKDIMTIKTRELELIEQLRDSVERNYSDFSLNFQPQVDASTGKITGAEALMRWNNAKYGALSPLEFIPLLEKSGLIHPVGRWTLHQAFAASKPWIDRDPDFTISINLSTLQVAHPDFIPTISALLREYAFVPSNVIFELSEMHITANIETLRDTLKRLRSMGVKIAMDDFGTGYSSLDILKMSPADIVKIDRIFVHNLKKSNFDATFIKFIVALCHDVNIRVCLEGVESADDFSIVQPMELDTMQGYLFGKPLSKDEFDVIIAKGQA